jgi:hypothetical protein
MTSTTQGEKAASLLAAIHALDTRALSIHETTDLAAFTWQPPEGGWSVGQVFEHLCVANDDYLVALRRVLAGTPPSPQASRAAARWKPSLAGRLLVRSFESSRKLPAPKTWRPAPVPRPDVIREFLTRQQELTQLIERSMALEWTRVRLASPVSPLIRMNVGDAFAILVTHAERHFRQIDRVRQIGVRVKKHRSNAGGGGPIAGHGSRPALDVGQQSARGPGIQKTGNG